MFPQLVNVGLWVLVEDKLLMMKEGLRKRELFYQDGAAWKRLCWMPNNP